MATTASERIGTLDTVRGVAVMGILFMNIVGFAMPEAAYLNPRAYGLSGPVDLWVYVANFILVDGKMRGLFSFLFGASMLLVIDRAEAKGESPAAIHYWRMGWLFVFGLAHLILLWWGDILQHYAVIGMVAYLFRHLPVRKLVGIGIALVTVEWLLLLTMPLAVLASQAALNDPATAERAAETLRGFNKGMGVPDAATIADTLARMRGGYAGIVAERLGDVGTTLLNNIFIGFETLGYMLFGMAALRSGMLTGRWERRRYRRWVAIGFGVGIPAYAAIAAWMISRGFDLIAIVAGVMAGSTPFRPFMIVGWAALVILLARPDGRLTQRVAAAGRMAFTNYLMTTIVMTTLFYGYGIGMFGHLTRAALYLPVAAMCAAMLLWSKPWLNRYRYGPFEWLWRTLSRRHLQPMRR